MHTGWAMGGFQVLEGQSWCFHDVTKDNSSQTTSADCSPPLNYDCELVTESIEIYSQVSGPMYRCSTGGDAPGPSPTGSYFEPVGTPVQTKSYQGVFQPNYTSPNGTYQFAKTPVLEAGQAGFYLHTPLCTCILYIAKASLQSTLQNCRMAADLHIRPWVLKQLHVNSSKEEAGLIFYSRSLPHSEAIICSAVRLAQFMSRNTHMSER